MPAKRRDSSKAREMTDVPARRRRGRPLSDKKTPADFGDLKTRPVPPRPIAGSLTQLKDAGPPDDIDLPSMPSLSFSTEKPR